MHEALDDHVECRRKATWPTHQCRLRGRVGGAPSDCRGNEENGVADVIALGSRTSSARVCGGLRLFALNKSAVQRTLHDLQVAGVVKLVMSKRGTAVELVAH